MVRLFSSLPRRVRLCVFCNSVLHIGISIQYLYFVFGVCILGSRSTFCFVLLVVSEYMPPKKKQGTEASPVLADEEGSEHSFASESTATGASSCTVTSELLERILEANHRSMAALITSLPVAHVPPVSPSRPTQIKVPKWSEEDTPFEYFTKYEKALTHNGIDKRSWGQLLPVYLTGRAQASFTQVSDDILDD